MFSSIDWLFPKGMDHHSMFAGVAEKVMATVARHLAGLGLLPDAAPPCPAPGRISVDVAVVGAGAAGLAAAEVLAAGGVAPLVLEQDDCVEGAGCSMLRGWLDRRSIVPGGRSAPAGDLGAGLYDDEARPVLLAIRATEGARFCSSRPATSSSPSRRTPR